jgi:uncharacterized integral membrane protein
VRLAGTTLLVAISALLVALAVANRQSVTVRLDPLSNAAQASVDLPLFVVVFGALMAGVALGGAAVALGRRGATRTHVSRGRARRRHARTDVPDTAHPVNPVPRPPRRRPGLFRR